MIRGRLRRLRGAEGHEEDQFIEIDPGELSRLFAAPGWLRDAGFTSWLLVGVVVLLAGVVWLLTLTSRDLHSAAGRRSDRGGGGPAGPLAQAAAGCPGRSAHSWSCW